MIAIAPRISRKSSVPRWHKTFLVMLPAIRRHASVSFRHLDIEARQEAVQEVICNAMAAYRRLVELNKQRVAHPSALARYGVAQVRAGRRIGGHLNVRDVTSTHCQRVKGIQVDRLDHFDPEEMCWLEILVEDRKAGPAETAASRIDFSSWFAALPYRQRRIAATLATGESTQNAARKFRVTAGRISQLRRELQQAWEMFVGERPAERQPCCPN